MTSESLFPSLEPREKGYLQVSEIHSIYWERSGNPIGKKIVVIHGGPGGGRASPWGSPGWPTSGGGSAAGATGGAEAATSQDSLAASTVQA